MTYSCRRAIRWMALAVVSCACATTLAAQSLPKLTAPVNDLAHVIDQASAAEMDRRIRALEKQTGDAVVVATVETIEPYDSIEDYAIKLFEVAGIGNKEKDNGLLIVLSKKERLVRIEVGYDLEEFIPDGYAGDVIRRDMLPEFRRGEYGAGLLAGTTRIITRIAEKRGTTLQDVPKPATEHRSDGSGISGLLPLAIIVIFLLLAISRARRRRWRRRGPWSGFGGPFGGGFGGLGGFGGFGGGGGGFGGGGGGGGFGGFGGGMSGGGGASGRW